MRGRRRPSGIRYFRIPPRLYNGRRGAGCLFDRNHIRVHNGTAGSTSTDTVPDVVLNTNKLTPDSANVIAKKLIDLANQEEKLSQSKKELQNLSGAAYNGG